MPESVISGLFALVTAAIGGLLGYGAAISATVRKEQNAAVIEFQSIFQRTLIKIDPRYKPEDTEINAVAILESDFDGHALAVMKFKQFIPSERAIGLETAWENYHAYKITEDHIWYRHFRKYRHDMPHGTADTESIIKNINGILEFAKLNHKSPFDPVEVELK